MADTRIKVILDLDSDISKAETGIKQLSEAFSKIGGSKGNALTGTLEQIEKEFTKLQNISGSAMSKVGDSSKAENSIIKIDSAIKKLSKELVNMGTLSADQAQKMFPPTILAKINKVNSAIKTYTSEIKKSESNAIKQATKEFEDQQKKVKDLTDELQKYEKLKSSKNLVSQDDYNKAKATQAVSKTAATKAQNKVASLQMQRQAVIDEYNSKTGKNTGAYSKGAKDLQVQIKAAQEEAKKLADNAKRAEDYFNSLEVKETLTSKIKNTKKALEEATQKSQDLQDNLNNVKADSVAKAMGEARKKLEGLTKVDLSKVTNIEQLNQLFEKFNQEGIEGFKKGVLEATRGIQQLDSANKGMARSVEENKDQVEKENRALSNVDGLKSRIQYFFSLGNSIQLFKRAIREAVETVKELDKAMTETAVVTDFSIGDMWNMLPQYTQMANELGVATQGVYEASTLYYQQGLQTEEVMALTAETLKMARIAGLEYSDATNLMTAALRGFNMEINETSAQRVNDVYSELAAITAADTNEIATAMTKTASIANSANMELETTAALLAQMIETTREPAETAGTAMKTIIARFTEMKKATSDIVSVDGEEISVNKVDAALASVGVSLKNAKGEFRDLDDVFIELASKWDSLDIMSQRYIATMAAGSRQQSRFIAMMSNYDRTLELVDAAYSSAGASSKQFEKTQESLESKIARLRNAWNEFLMGISNNSIIKLAVDLLTGLLNAINKLTTVPEFLPFNELTTSVLKLAAAIGIFKVASKGIDKILKSFRVGAEVSKEIRSINMTGAFTNNRAATQEDIEAARTGDRKYFKEKINPKKTKVPVELEVDEAKSAAEGAKNGAIISEAAETAAKADPIETESNTADATQEGIEYGTLWYRTADGVVHEKPLGSIADLQNAREQGAVWAKMFKAGVEIELSGEGLAAFEAQMMSGQSELSTWVRPSNNEPLLLGQGSKYNYSNVVDVPYVDVLPKKNPLQESFSKSKEASAQKTKQFFDALKKDGGGLNQVFQNLGETGKKAATKVSSGFGSVLGVITSIPPVVWGVVGAIAAVTAAVYALWHASEEQVLKRSLEEASLQTDNLATAQEELSQRLDKVNEGFETLSNHRATLDSLVQGTLAWNEALLANNETVLELIKNNPELSEYMSVGEGGELTISKEGQNAYVEKLLKQQAGAQVGLLNNQAYKSYLEGESAILEEFKGRDSYTVASDSTRGVRVTQSFKNAYEQGKTDVAGTREERVAYQEYYNAKKRNEEQLVKSLAGNAKGFLKEDATEIQQNAVSKIAEGLMTNSDINNLDGKYIQGLKISKGLDAAKLDAREATEETIKGLTDYQLASAGFEWTDSSKTALKKIGADSETTFQVTKGGHVDTEDNVNDWLKKNKKNVNIDAGYIMSQVAKAEIPNNYNAIAAAITEGLSDDALKTISGEALDDVAGAQNAIKKQYIDLKNQLNETTDEEGKKILEDAISYYENEFKGIDTDNFSLTKRNESNKNDIIASLLPYGIDLEGASVEKLNNYKSVIDKFSSFGLDGARAISAFNNAYNNFAESVNKEEFTNFATSLNTNSAIEGFKQLKEGAESSNEAIKAFSESMLESSERGGFYSGLSQLKELVSSEEFTDPKNGLAKELAKISDKGELAASDILELAESGTLLDSALEAGALSAGALAEVFQQMTEEGKDLNDFTQTYINYLNELTASATASAEALQFVKNFTAPDAQTSAQEDWMEWATELRERAAAGAYNDQAFTALLKNFASTAQWEEWEKNDTSNSDRYKALQSIIKNSEKGSYSVLKAGATSEETGNATYLSNGQLKFNLSEYGSTKDLITGIAKQYKISEDYAKQLISDARIYNTELDKGLKTLDKQNAFKQDFRTYGKKNENGQYEMTINNEFAQKRGYDSAKEYQEAFESYFENSTIEISTDVKFEMTPNTIDKFKEYVKNKINSNPDEGVSVYSIVGAGQAAGLSNKQIMEQTKAAVGDIKFNEIQAQLQKALTAAQDAADAEQKANIAEQKAAVYDAYYEGVSQGMLDALNGLEVPITISFTNADGTVQEVGGKFAMGGDGSKAGTKNNIYNEGAKQAAADAEAQRKAYDEMIEALEDIGTPNPNPVTDPTVNPYTPYDPNNKGSSDKDKDKEKEKEKRNYAEENANKQLEALDRVRETNDREAELIEKLPEEIQFPLKMANLGEDMLYEYQEIQINKNKQAALQNQLDAEESQAKYLGEYYYYDEFTDAYMYDVEKMESDDLDDEKRQEIEEEISSLQEINDKLNAVEDELDGGKIQKVFRTLEKATDGASKALKKEAKAADLLEEEFGGLAKQLGLDDELKKFGDSIDNTIKSSKLLNKSFEGLGIVSEETLSKLDKLPIGDNTKNLIKNTLGKNEGGTIGSVMGDMFGASSDMFGSIGDILNFDMMSMGLDGMNMMKDMGQKMIQYVVQFVQTIINWWINREDWLYNLLSAIEQEVRNFNRQSEVEERFRLYSDEGLNDLVSAWEAMRASLEKQIDLNEQLIESRQAELQFLNMTNLPFAPAFYYDYAEERVIENPWVYDIYVLLLDLGAMIPEFGQIFSSIKQLMEDNKKRMEDAVQEIEDARDKILELEKQQLELRTKYMEDEIELEELVMDTIIEKQQEQIDELSTMNEAIEQGNEKLIQTLNDNLDRIRQQRENQDKEEELAEKERRLAYLRQDTSNANRAEIMNLQEELKDERRDYTDELIDQKISELEKQNELAAEQRQKQIDLLQSQLDYTEKYGLQWAEAQTLIKNGFDSEGRLRVGTDLYNMLMSKEDFTSMGLGSTRQTQQIMDWNVTSIAAAAFREINDIWEEGFGNFEMSNDVHDQSRLHLWEDRQVDYYQLPSWLSFLQPAANTIQDYLWRTGNNISAFVETGFLSGKNSSSILGKTVVPLLQGIYKAVVGRVDEYNSLNEAETGGFEEVSGAITQASDNLGYGLGEKLVNGISNAFASVGGDIINGFTNSMSNYAVPKTQTQTTGNFNMNFYINSEDREEGMSIGESVLRAFREGISNLSIFG